MTNLFSDNKLFDTWDAKVVISCRTDYLIKDYTKYFIPFFGGNRQNHLLQEVHLTPFNDNQIEQIEQTRKSINQWRAK